MSEPSESNVAAMMMQLGESARTASRTLAVANSKQKRTAIIFAADEIEKETSSIQQQNLKDLNAAKKAGLSKSMIDRLELNDDRITAMANGLREIAKLDDPVGSVIAQWQRPNGLDIQRVRTPLGVIGVIYESRPNVTADAGALSLMAGNAVILR